MELDVIRFKCLLTICSDCKAEHKYRTKSIHVGKNNDKKCIDSLALIRSENIYIYIYHIDKDKRNVRFLSMGVYKNK